MNIKLYDLFCKFISYLSILILSVLTMFSVISTTYVDSYDRVFYFGDHAYIHGIAIILLLALGYVFRTKFRFKVTDRILITALTIMTAIVAIYITLTNLVPRFDQRAVRSVAGNLVYGITDDFLPGGYGEIYPYNHGIILFYEFIIRVSGYDNYIVMQYINLFFMVLTQIALYFVMKRITCYFREISLGLIIFIPYWGYATFLYGNIPGFCMGMWALYFSLVFLEEFRMYEAIAAGILMSAAFRFKENFAILAIAIAILALCEVIKSHKYKGLLLIAAMVFFIGISGFAVNRILETEAHYHPGKGIPGLPYIAMGLHEHESRGAGWHDNYPEVTYEDVGYDITQSIQLAKEDIAGSIDNFRQHPKYMAGFFVRKIASMWNDPTYYSWTLQQGRDNYWDRVLFLPGIKLVYGIMNVMQTFLYFFALLYFIFNRNNNDFKQLFFVIFFIGGFLCHILWEAHCQYALFYAMGLATYSTEGIALSCKRIIKMEQKERIRAAIVCAIVCMILSVPAMTSVLTLNRSGAGLGFIEGI
ncbi:MAG: hypothetical protein IJV16_08790 [Lachnospiraceae bacterium]|nr:hypothetical protein [Lachnospiraceae bacterium]MBR1524952.1 hypothetical protein [Lachnospiraceae bacterium]